MQISNIFMFQDDYGYFDVNSDGKELAETLKYLLSNENDELKSSAASLLFDIYNVRKLKMKMGEEVLTD